jgi:hypothetical protein
MVARRQGAGAVGYGEAPPSAAVGTPIKLPAPAGPWRCSAREQRPGWRGELCRCRPPPPPRLRAIAAALPGTQPQPGPGCLPRMLRPGRRGELRRPAPLLPHCHHSAPGVADRRPSCPWPALRQRLCTNLQRDSKKDICNPYKWDIRTYSWNIPYK